MKFQKSYKKNATAHVSSLGKEKNLHKQYPVYCCLYWWHVTMAGTVAPKEHPLRSREYIHNRKACSGSMRHPTTLDSKSTKCENWLIRFFFFLTWLTTLALHRNSFLLIILQIENSWKSYLTISGPTRTRL